MGADYSFELISIETYALQFIWNNTFFLGSVITWSPQTPIFWPSQSLKCRLFWFQIQEVHVTDDAGNVQHMYTYASNDVVDASELAKQDDPSFEFYDNARGKINLNVLIKLAAKFNIDDNIVSKHENLVRWDELVNEYNAVTNQSKPR